jgi:hypothetical protein
VRRKSTICSAYKFETRQYILIFIPSGVERDEEAGMASTEQELVTDKN